MTMERVYDRKFWLDHGFREGTLINNPLYLECLVGSAENEFSNRDKGDFGFKKTTELANLIDRQLELFNGRGEKVSPVSINPNFFWPLTRTVFENPPLIGYGPYVNIHEPGNFPSDIEISKRWTLLRDQLKSASSLTMEEKRVMEGVCRYLKNQILEYQKHLRQMKREIKKALESY